MRQQSMFVLCMLLGGGFFAAAQPAQIADERLLFDFEDAASLNAWVNLELPDAKEKDKFWKAIVGMHWGDDPDFLPVYIAHGPGGGQVSVWDFKEAIRV